MYPTPHFQHIVPPSNHRSMNYNPAQNGAERRQPPNTASPKAMEPNNQPVIPKIPVQTSPFGDVVIDSGRSIIRGLKIPCIETTTPHRSLRIRANLAEAYPDAERPPNLLLLQPQHRPSFPRGLPRTPIRGREPREKQTTPSPLPRAPRHSRAGGNPEPAQGLNRGEGESRQNSAGHHSPSAQSGVQTKPQSSFPKPPPSFPRRREPRTRGKMGAGHHSPSAKICVIRGSDKKAHPRSTYLYPNIPQSQKSPQSQISQFRQIPT